MQTVNLTVTVWRLLLRVTVPGDWPWDVRVKVHLVDGVPQITSLHIDQRQRTRFTRAASPDEAVITHDWLRRLPLRHMARIAATGGDLDAVTALAYEELGEWPSGKPRPGDHYRQVATSYREAAAAGSPPLQAVMKRWGVSRAGASKWVRIARDRKLLGEPPRPGVAGEKTTRGSKTKGGKS